MTSEQQTYIDKKFQEIDIKLEKLNLTEEEKQILLEERAEYEEQSEELDCDNNSNYSIEEIWQGDPELIAAFNRRFKVIDFNVGEHVKKIFNTNL